MPTARNKGHPQIVKDRIKTGLLAKRLEDHALGNLKHPMTSDQIRAAEILLRKTVPDARTDIAVEGDMTWALKLK